MKVLADYQSEISSLLQDAAGDLDPADRDKAIVHAIAAYSRSRPRRIVADVVGDGGADYTPPSGWIEQFSKIVSIEFPIGEVPEVFLDENDFKVYQTTAAEKIRLIVDRPSAAESFRIVFMGLHSVAAASGTIGDGDFSAVCHLAAASACRMLANKYSQNIDPTIGADAVDHKSKAFEFSQRARELEKFFRTALGIKDDGAPAAGMAFKDTDVDYPWGEDRLTHPRRQR